AGRRSIRPAPRPCRPRPVPVPPRSLSANLIHARATRANVLHLTPGRMSMNRRECLSTAAAAVAAGTAFLAEAVGQEKNPAAQVADKTTPLRITALRTYWVNPVVFVKIETNHGAVGWGEIKGIDPRVAKTLAEALYPLLDGENPTRIEHLWQKVYRAHRDIR